MSVLSKTLCSCHFFQVFYEKPPVERFCIAANLALFGARIIRVFSFLLVAVAAHWRSIGRGILSWLAFEAGDCSFEACPPCRARDARCCRWIVAIRSRITSFKPCAVQSDKEEHSFLEPRGTLILAIAPSTMTNSSPTASHDVDSACR